MHEFTEKLFAVKESENGFCEFSKKIISDTSLSFIGVKIPKIRALAKSLPLDTDKVYGFFNEKHVFLEEVLLHGFLIAKIKDQKEIYRLIEGFLPSVDSWAVTDTVVPMLKTLAKDKPLLLRNVEKWLLSDKPYTVRFGIVMLLDYYVDDLYADTAIRLASLIKSEDYYVNMAISWLYSVILIKYYDKMIKIIEEKSLPRFIQNKTISKATDSFRITKDKKEYLKTLKI